jgi:hypothetical protein
MESSRTRTYPAAHSEIDLRLRLPHGPWKSLTQSSCDLTSGPANSVEHIPGLVRTSIFKSQRSIGDALEHFACNVGFLR